jgi:ferredoxin-thioredoxin reductase catalytic subunit/rubredoxin
MSEEVQSTYEKLKKDNVKRGYFLNHDETFTLDLVESLLTNEKRFGYQACPCRLATGKREEDLDIICPCAYRDSDVAEFGTCFCGLYTSKKILDDLGKVKPIPDRRIKERIKMNEGKKYPIWRCTVCGYLCSRAEAPDVCPICGASHDRFEKYEDNEKE